MEFTDNQQPNNNQQNPAPQTAPVPTQTLAAPKHNVAMAVLAYIGPLVIVSYLVVKDDSFVKYHIKQGLVLLVIEVALSLIGSMMYMFWPIIQLIHIAIVVFAIIGIMNVIKGNEKELPLLGKFGSYFKI